MLRCNQYRVAVNAEPKTERPQTSQYLKALLAQGHSLSELSPAFPGLSIDQIKTIVVESGLCLNRPVLPYGILGLLPQKSETFNVSSAGYRLNGAETAWPPDPKYKNVFFFGGSTAMGFGVADRDTIPANLERLLLGSKKCRVYNFGYGSFTSRQEFLRLLDLCDHGFKPDLAVFLDGLNDTHYAFGNDGLVHLLSDLYLDEKQRRRLNYLGAILDYAKALSRIKKMGGVADYKPSRYEQECAALLTDENIKAALAASELGVSPNELTPFHEVVGINVLKWYQTSRDLIVELSKREKFRTLFVWQPIPFLATKAEQRLLERLLFLYRYHLLCAYAYRWLEAKEFKPLSEGSEVNVLNLYALGRTVSGPLYIDSCHYTPLFSEVIAKRIAEEIIQQL